ncbi:MAG: hypothetical protein AB7S70_02660 [Hyphomicrobium sp.]|uniref:hypothetical protein n=1 Tax=Hyphomicrobium sp. TaxID=82 RepID=UPI003D140055
MTAYRALPAALAALLWCSAAGAIQQVKSLYTAVDLSKCQPAAGEEHAGPAWSCDGLPGFPVYVASAPQGVYLSVGANADKQRAAGQTLKSANTVFEPGGMRTTIEWRFVVRGGRPVPYATIVRYFTHDATAHGEVLVVMRVTENEVCHVAHVDALANLDAMVLARKLADTDARAKPCPDVPAVQGARGRSPM